VAQVVGDVLNPTAGFQDKSRQNIVAHRHFW